MSQADLTRLEKAREQITAGGYQQLWLVELGAWLHNAGKLSVEFLTNDVAFNYQLVGGSLLQKATDVEEGFPLNEKGKRNSKFSAAAIKYSASTFENKLPPTILRTPLHLDGPFRDRDDYAVAALIDLQNSVWYRYAGLKTVFGLETSYLTELMQICHERASNIEKEGEEPQQPKGDKGRFRSTVFGFETRITGDANAAWNRFGFNAGDQTLCFGDRRKFLEAANDSFGSWTADGRWPINDVTLLDISFAAAAFYKSAVAKCLLEEAWPWSGAQANDDKAEKSNDPQMRWRILRLSADGPAYYSRVARIPDLLIRRKLLDGVFDNIQRLLEEKLFLANEIYRDEYGSCFLLPGLANDDDALVLKSLVQERIEAVSRERVTVHALGRGDHQDDEAAYEITLKLDITGPDARGRVLHEALAFSVPSLRPDLARMTGWWKDGTNAICSVCQVRPIGPSEKSVKRKVCGSCEIRREDRSMEWTSNLGSTIWLDEVADKSGRVALIAGRFDLTQWLTGQAIEETLFLSPAFRQEAPGRALIASEIPSKNKRASFARILRVVETTKQFWRDTIQEQLKALRGTRPQRWRIPIDQKPNGRYHSFELCSGRAKLSVVYDAQEGSLITAENLERAVLLCEAENISQLRQMFLEKNCRLEEPTGYGGDGSKTLEVRTGSISEIEGSYTPLIEVLAEPRDVLFVVPGDHAIETLIAIKNKYEMEMGKVRDRLPIHLAAVFSSTSTPFSALYDASSRMMDRNHSEKDWQIREFDWTPASTEAKLEFENGIRWEVPCTMGTKIHQDVWYPYFRINDGLERLELVQNIGKIRDEKKPVTMKVNPSTFDYEFIDAAGERFEIAYKDGQRRGDLRENRPHFLERLPEFTEIRDDLIGNLGNAQIHDIHGLLREKKLCWKCGDSSETWRAFVVNAFAAAHWPGPAKFVDLKPRIETWLRNGVLLDALEFWLHISKSKKAKEDSENEQALPK